MNKYFLLLLFNCIVLTAFSQNNHPKPDNGKEGIEENSSVKGIGLISDKDTLISYLKTWQISRSNFIINAQPDTLLRLFQVFDPIHDNYFPGTRLNTGNIGSPVYSNVLLSNIPDIGDVYDTPLLESIFTNRQEFLFQSYYPYLYTIDNCRFYHTNKPFTSIAYTMNTEKVIEEQTLNFTHSQNVNNNLNIGLNFKMIGSEGMYASQKTSNNAIQVFSSYFNKRYNMHSVIGVNRLKIGENGGITTIEDKEIETTAIPVFLNSKSNLKQINYSLIQRLNIGKKIEIIKPNAIISDTLNEIKVDSLSIKNDSLPVNILIDYKAFSSIIHRIDINRTNRIYQDRTDSSTYYQNYFFPRRVGSLDSTRYLAITNSIEWLLPTDNQRRLFPNSGLRIIGGHEFEKYHALKNYVRVNENDEYFSNVYMGGNVFRQKGDFQIDAGSRLYLGGRKIGNLNLSCDLKGNIKLKNDSALLSVSGQFNVERPTYFEENYSSSNFRWNNSFKEVIELKVKGILAIPKWKAYAGIEYSTIDNYVYFNTEASPSQLEGSITTISLFGQKDFHLKNFHSIFKFVSQTYTNKDVLHLPELILYNSTYVSLNTKAVTAHIGADISFTSTYKAPAYSPALGTFYLQNSFETGKRPIIDVFANFKLKNALLFFKYEHISSLLYDEKYFPVYQHPYNDGMFKIGVAWKFFN